MTAGGFPSRKWVTNRPKLLQNLDPSECLRSTWINFTAEGPVRELGIAWDPRENLLGIKRPSPPNNKQSKRQILSTLTSIFDPRGWLAPATLTIKLLLQDLWRVRLSWDEELPASIRRRWDSLNQEFALIDKMSIPRWISTKSAHCDAKIHAFADASRRAMAAVVYSRTITVENSASVNLLVAKTKLSPIRSLRPSAKPLPRMTVPRLELRAALIAARLLHRICEELKIPIESCQVWSDSQIALEWIRSSEPTDNAIVDNYVHQMQELTPREIWRYVPSKLNPADVASRGMSLKELQQSPDWFLGPEWLKLEPSQWPIDQRNERAGEYEEIARAVLTNLTERRDTHHTSAFSDIERLLTFLVRLRRCVRRRLNRTPVLAPSDALTPEELDTALEACILLSQKPSFSNEIDFLKAEQQKEKPRPLPGKGPLRALHPFVCPAGILRVGGRLEHSELLFNQKHPPILDGSNHLAGLIVAWAHKTALHGGFCSTYAIVLQRAWLIGGKRRIRRYIQHCAACAKSRAAPLTQLMGPLPSARVTPIRAFAKTGVDYAGPFHLLPTRGRGVRTVKSYVAVFVYMASRAVHLELAGDLSAESFKGALTRFFGLRGTPREIWSDNAMTSHRADVDLREALNQKKLKWGTIQNHLALQGVAWKFIPPAAPHFGGLWEAAVRSFKTHLKKVIGGKHLTVEEFTTLLVSVSAVLNCRPLGPISDDLDDLHACTPAHLIIGSLLLTVPEVDVNTDRLDYLQHWKLVQGLRAKFWQQWSKEYLNTLQQRGKWTRRRENVVVSNLVLVLDPSLIRSNGQWPLGRVTEVHPSRDGLVRFITVKTEHGVYVRPIVKLAALPIAENATEDPTAEPALTSPPRRAAATYPTK